VLAKFWPDIKGKLFFVGALSYVKYAKPQFSMIYFLKQMFGNFFAALEVKLGAFNHFIH